jgi:hypothetical protein
MNDYTEDLTPENAKRYAEHDSADRSHFCAGLTGYSDSWVNDALERDLAALAFRLGYMEPIGELKIKLTIAIRRNTLGHVLCEQVTIFERDNAPREMAEKITNEFVSANPFPVGYGLGTLEATWRANEKTYFYENENGLFRLAA